jgi:hypothetical protein
LFESVPLKGGEIKTQPVRLENLRPKDTIFYFKRSIQKLLKNESLKLENYDDSEISVINSRSQMLKMIKFLENVSSKTEKELTKSGYKNDLKKKRLYTILSTWETLGSLKKLKLYN